MNLESVKDYYGFHIGDIVKLNTSVETDGKIVDKGELIQILSFPVKTTRHKQMLVNHVPCDIEETSRKRFIKAENMVKYPVRCYIQNIEKI